MGKQVRVVNHRDARVVLSCASRDDKGVLKIDELVLESGANNVDSDRMEAFCQEGSMGAVFVEHGVLDVQDLPEPKVEEPSKLGNGDLAKLTEDAALKAVAACKSKPQLSKWIKQDGRKNVRNALIKRYEELNAEEGQPKED